MLTEPTVVIAKTMTTNPRVISTESMVVMAKMTTMNPRIMPTRPIVVMAKIRITKEKMEIPPIRISL